MVGFRIVSEEERSLKGVRVFFGQFSDGIRRKHVPFFEIRKYGPNIFHVPFRENPHPVVGEGAYDLFSSEGSRRREAPESVFIKKLIVPFGSRVAGRIEFVPRRKRIQHFPQDF